MKSETKRTIRNIIYWIFIIGITVFIFVTSSKIGNSLSSSEKVSNESVKYTLKEDSKNFSITYNQESYTIKDSDNKIIMDNVRLQPIITSDKYSSSAKKIQDVLENLSTKRWESALYYSIEYSKSENISDIVSTEYVFNLKDYKEDEYITFEFNINESFGTSEMYGYTFDVKSGDLLTLDSITSDYETLYQLILNELINIISTDDYVDQFDSNWKEELKKLLVGEQLNIYFSDDKINVVVPANSIGNGKYLFVEVKTKDNDQINKLILENYKK